MNKKMLIALIHKNNLQIMSLLRRKHRRLKLILLWKKRLNYLIYLIQRNISLKSRIWSLVEESKYWENDVPHFTSEKFKNVFRMSRQTFLHLVEKLKHLERYNTKWRDAIPLDKRIAAVLYALGSSAEYRTVASLFGIGRSTLGELVVETSKEIWDVLKEEVFDAYPPTQSKINEIVGGFETLGFPQCYGAIDGCHIEVSPTKLEAADYFNFKGWYSTILFAAVDYRYRFTYINVGVPGRCSDSTIFECSKLKVQHLQNRIFEENAKIIEGVSGPVLLIGDSAFKLSKIVMKPFPFHSEQSNEEKLFNTRISACRRVVENVFGHLKARFRRIGKGLEVDLKNVPNILKACCALHNMCNIKNDTINEKWLNELKGIVRQRRPTNRSSSSNNEGSEIRKALMKHFGRVSPLLDLDVEGDADGSSSGGDGADGEMVGSSGDGGIGGDSAKDISENE